MFYIDAQDHMFFQQSLDLGKSHTEHLFHLRLECKGKSEADSYHSLVSFELNKRWEELLRDDFKWIKPKNLIEANKVCLHDFQLD